MLSSGETAGTSSGDPIRWQLKVEKRFSNHEPRQSLLKSASSGGISEVHRSRLAFSEVKRKKGRFQAVVRPCMSSGVSKSRELKVE